MACDLLALAQQAHNLGVGSPRVAGASAAPPRTPAARRRAGVRGRPLAARGPRSAVRAHRRWAKPFVERRPVLLPAPACDQEEETAGMDHVLAWRWLSFPSQDVRSRQRPLSRQRRIHGADTAHRIGDEMRVVRAHRPRARPARWRWAPTTPLPDMAPGQAVREPPGWWSPTSPRPARGPRARPRGERESRG